MSRRSPLIDPEELKKPFHGPLAEKFPPLLSLDQLAELVGRSVKTIYDWKAKGHLDTVLRKRGKHCYVWRDEFLNHFLNGANW